MKIDELIAGDTLDFYDDVSEYPPSDGWTLKYFLVPRFTAPTQTPIELVAVTEGERYRVQKAAGTTAGWKPGDYTWARWVEKSGLRQSLGSGQLEILPDPAGLAQGYDGRSHARKMVDNIEVAIEALNHGVRSYAIAGRSWTKENIADLLKLRDRYRSELADELAADVIASGGGNPRVMKGRFSRA